MSDLVQIKVIHTEVRCDICLSGSEGTCTPDRILPHVWTPIKVATGYPLEWLQNNFRQCEYCPEGTGHDNSGDLVTLVPREPVTED